MKMNIIVSKDIIKKAIYCGTDKCDGYTSENCAVALAVRDIFPNAAVDGYNIYTTRKFISLPRFVTEFIRLFDSLKYEPKERLKLEPVTFEVDIPDS